MQRFQDFVNKKLLKKKNTNPSVRYTPLPQDPLGLTSLDNQFWQPMEVVSGSRDEGRGDEPWEVRSDDVPSSESSDSEEEPIPQIADRTVVAESLDPFVAFSLEDPVVAVPIEKPPPEPFTFEIWAKNFLKRHSSRKVQRDDLEENKTEEFKTGQARHARFEFSKGVKKLGQQALETFGSNCFPGLKKTP